MNKSEAAKLLAFAAACDRRTVGPTDVLAWHELLAGIDYDDAAQAVRNHYATSPEWLMPVHVIRGVRDLRRARLDGYTDPVPAVDPSNPGAYIAALRAARKAAADTTTTKEITA